MLFVKAKMDLWSTFISGALALIFPNTIARIIDGGNWQLWAWVLLIFTLISLQYASFFGAWEVLKL